MQRVLPVPAASFGDLDKKKPLGFDIAVGRGRWLSRDTLRVRLSFVVYSPELDMLLLSNLELLSCNIPVRVRATGCPDDSS